MASESNNHILSGLTSQLTDSNTEETEEWVESLRDLVKTQGTVLM